MTQKINPLTPLEETRTEERAYKAWLEKQGIYNPPPEPRTSDLVSDNRKVMDILVAAVGWLPLILAIVGIAAVVVSADKTSAAFEASVAHKDGLWGAWAYIVALSAVVMVDLAMVVAEFALVRDMLRKGLKRQVWNLASAWRSVKVRLGTARPLDYNEMPDGSLQFYSNFLFVLIVAANVYAVTKTGSITRPSDITFETGLLLFTGVAGALSLKFLGKQLSHIVYDMAAERREMQRLEMFESWRHDMQRMWETDGPEIVAQALHGAFVKKNRLAPGEQSPYLLMAGEDEEGKPEIQATPFQTSWTASLTPSENGSSNGGQERM